MVHIRGFAIRDLGFRADLTGMGGAAWRGPLPPRYQNPIAG